MSDGKRRSSVLARRLVVCCWMLAFGGISPSALWPKGAVSLDLEPGVAELLGDWEAQRTFQPSEAIHLLVQRDGEQWTAEVAGARAAGQRRPRFVEFSFSSGAVLRLYGPGETGDQQFAETMTPTSSTLLGHWLQPPGVSFNNVFAAPVTFTSASAERAGPKFDRGSQTSVDVESGQPTLESGSWFGTVEPLVDRLTFGLRLEEEKDAPGGVRSLLRNPERNYGRFLRLGAIEREGDVVRWLRPEGEGVALEGRYHANTDTLSLHFAFQGLTFDFTRRATGQALTLSARPGDEPARYGVPLDRGDGWKVADARRRGFDIERLEKAVQSIATTRFDSLRSPQVHSLLIARGGTLVLEESFHGHHAEQPHDTRSSAKSLTGVLAGLAIDAGAEFSPDTPLRELLVREKQEGADDARKDLITVAHALSMNSGLDCDDNDGETPGNEDVMQSQRDQPDWVRYTLDLPMVREPGAEGVYCTAGIHLLSGVLEKTVPAATGQSLLEWLHRSWMQPLHIERYHWNLSPVGRPYLGGGVRMRPRDHLKMGQVVLDGGRWQGERVLSAEWVAEMTAAQSGINRPDDYGYGWWRETMVYAEAGSGVEREVEVLQASGNGGQLVIVIPELDLVIGFMGGNYGDFRTWISWLREFVPEKILPAVGG